MADRSNIEWTDATWNPIGGCTRVDEGCRNCYAEIMAARFSGPGQWGEGLARIVRGAHGGVDHRWTGQMRLNESALDRPLRWRKPRRIFVNSTSDLFHDSVPDEWIDRVFAVMALCPQHTFQCLSKRLDRMREYVTARDLRHRLALSIGEVSDASPELEYAAQVRVNNMSLPNVWLGTSISDQASADLRIPHLLATPAAVRFVSAEPLLGPVDLTRLDMLRAFGVEPDSNGFMPRHHYDALRGQSDIHPIHGAEPDWGALHLVIVGGESGPGARPMHPEWPRALRDQCVAAGVAYFHKQNGEFAWAERIEGDPTTLTAYRVGKARAGRLLDNREWNQLPGDAE